jgi:GH25 family lysozyme M1 (1,4-beta-N-acetylmuramidase)
MAGFFDDQDREDRKAYKRAVIYFIAATSLVMLLFLLVIYSNTKEKRARQNALARQEAEEAEKKLEEDKLEDEALGIGEHNLTSQDLDFWDMYEDNDKHKDEDNDNLTLSENSSEDILDKDDDREEYLDELKKKVSENRADRDNEDSIMLSEDEKKEKEKAEDGKHIKAKTKDGDPRWYDIDEEIPKNSYDLKANLSMDEETLEYKDRGVTTRRGVDVSKYQGTIDWQKVKEAGIDFAMIRVGARGYSGGQLMLDDNFVANITGAKAAGLDTGVYFFSQAVTEEEAVEEANFTVGALINYGVTYPVAIDVEWIEDDKARTDELTKTERTGIAKAFCDTIKTFGYSPMVYASRDMLIAGMYADDLVSYDVWLGDDYEPEDGTDYPYNFSMWQYTRKGKVDGITGDVDINLRFVNNKEK